jgi:predicted Rossmann fold flavoprotein
VIIIGAGASGLFCAIECGRRGRSVLVLDHADRACSKVLVSGGGRCNFTNLNVTPAHYLSSNPHFCRSALARFTPGDLLAILKAHRIPFFEKEAGQLFCARTSRDIASSLKQECDNANAVVRLGCRIDSVKKEERFRLVTGQGIFLADSLVVATGGLSYQNLGASGFGHDLARQFGLNVIPPRPALVPFTWRGPDKKMFQGLAGVSVECAISCGKKEFPGSMLFTHRGLSGPAALQASLYWNRGEALAIDLLPGEDMAAVFETGRGAKLELKICGAVCSLLLDQSTSTRRRTCEPSLNGCMPGGSFRAAPKATALPRLPPAVWTRTRYLQRPWKQRRFPACISSEKCWTSPESWAATICIGPGHLATLQGSTRRNGDWGCREE